MKFKNPYFIFNGRMDTHTRKHAHKQKAIGPFNFFKVGGIKVMMNRYVKTFL